MIKKDRKTVTVTFSYNPDDYPAIHLFLNSQPERRKSAAICEKLDEALRKGGVSIGDVYETVKGIERTLKAGVALSAGSEDDCAQWNGSPETANELMELAKEFGQ